MSGCRRPSSLRSAPPRLAFPIDLILLQPFLDECASLPEDPGRTPRDSADCEFSSRASWRLHHTGDAHQQRTEFSFFLRELFAAGGCDVVEARSPIVFGKSPFGDDVVIHEQPLQCRVKRAFTDFQRVIGNLLNVLRDSVSMVRAAA